MYYRELNFGSARHHIASVISKHEITFSRAQCENDNWDDEFRGVGAGGSKAPKFSENTERCPLSGGKVPFAFVKNVVQIAFYMIAIIFDFPLPPPSRRQHFWGKKFSGALLIPKVPLGTASPQSFDASYAPG